jgi:tetratricopeptide (TPR) repeat protein
VDDMNLKFISNWLNKRGPEQKIRNIRLDRKNASIELIKYGEDMANAKRYDEALSLFEKATQVDPLNDMAWGDKALMLDKLGKTDEALISFSKALSIDANNEITWHNKGLTLIRAKKLRESIDCFDMAIKLRENYAKAWYNKGRAYVMLGEGIKAKPCLDKAKKLDPMLYTKLTKV